MNKMKIYEISVLVVTAILLLVNVLFIKNAIIGINIIIWGVILTAVPYGVYNYITYKRMKDMESVLPMFLRSIADHSKSGLNLYDCFKMASKEDYGPLSKELKKMVSEASWNVGMNKAIKKFIDRTDSKTIKRVMYIIMQAYISGGDITKISESLAANLEKIKEIEKKRKSLMSQHVTMIYAIFFIFIGIVLVLLKFMAPMMSISMGASQFGMSFGGDPCSVCHDPIVCIGCPIFNSVCLSLGLGKTMGAQCYYKGMFFTMILIQAVFSGLISGVIESNSLKAGLKHLIIMSLSGILIFMLIGWLGII